MLAIEVFLSFTIRVNVVKCNCMKRKILLINVNDRCYASYRFFAQKLAQAMEKQECEVGWCTVQPGKQQDTQAWGDALKTAQEFRPDAVVDFNSFLPKLSAGGRSLPELFDAPFYNYILDHPLYHHKALSADGFDYRCICVDEGHGTYIKKYYPGIRSVFTCPLPGSIGSSCSVPYEDRKNQILFCGTYEEPDRYWRLIRELPSLMAAPCMNMAEQMLADPEVTLESFFEAERPEEITSGGCGNGAKTVRGGPIPVPERMQAYFLVDAFVRNMRRKQILTAIVKEGIPLELYGNGWEQFCREAVVRAEKEKVFPAAKKKIQIFPAVSYENYVNLIGNYRFVLNIMPGFVRGTHDRITCGMRNGSLVITDTNVYVKAHYGRRQAENGQEQEQTVADFSLQELQKLPELCRRYLDQPDQARIIAERGRSYGNRCHTWEGLSKLILTDMEQETEVL